MAQFLSDIDDGSAGGTQTAGGGGVTPPPPGGGTATGNAFTVRYVDVNWQHAEPEPVGALQGFEIAFHVGTDPTISDNWIQDSIKLKPSERRYVGILQMRQARTVYASVRALYQDGYTSAWSVATVSSSFTPDTVLYGDEGFVVFPDGTIMLWKRGSSQSLDGNQSITWPNVVAKGVNYTGFPNGCYCVQIVTMNEDGSNINDRFFQLTSYSQTGCVVYGQGTADSANGHPVRPFVTAWGF